MKIEDLLIDFDEMGFAPTTLCENPDEYAREWKEQLVAEIERLKSENEKNCWNCIESKRVTSEDYSKLQEQFADYQLSSEKEIRAHEERAKVFENIMKSVLEIEKENVRKETAKSIYEKAKFVVDITRDLMHGKKYLYLGVLKEIVNRLYDVEVEE